MSTTDTASSLSKWPATPVDAARSARSGDAAQTSSQVKQGLTNANTSPRPPKRFGEGGRNEVGGAEVDYSAGAAESSMRSANDASISAPNGLLGTEEPPLKVGDEVVICSGEWGCPQNVPDSALDYEHACITAVTDLTYTVDYRDGITSDEEISP
eukprot:SAG31_NODE_18251_length_642_cov_0.985267_1_plen_154_part_10